MIKINSFPTNYRACKWKNIHACHQTKVRFGQNSCTCMTISQLASVLGSVQNVREFCDTTYNYTHGFGSPLALA